METLQKPRVPDFGLQSVLACFQTLANPQANPSHMKEADAYLSLCEQEGFVFLGILLNLFQSGQDPQIRLQSLICFNNVIKRNWSNKKIKDSTLPNFESDKVTIKTQLIRYLSMNQRIFLRTILDGVVFVGQQDFPHNFPQLDEYIIQVLDNVHNVPFLIDNLKAFNEIYSRMRLKKTSIHNKFFQQSSLKMMQKLFPLFHTLHSNIGTADQDSFKLTRIVYKMVCLLLITAPHQMIDHQQILSLVQMVYSKAEELLATLVQNPNPEYQKTLKVQIEYLGYIQSQHPFSLTNCLGKYVKLCMYIVDNQQKFKLKNLVKFAVVSLTKVMKTFVYYSSDEQFQKSNYTRSKALSFLQLRQTMHLQYKDMINEKSVEPLLSKLITQVLSIKDSRYLDVGLNVQDEDFKIEDKDASVGRAALTLVETIINRFPEHALELISNLLRSCLANGFEGMDRNVKVNIMGVCSVLPSAFKANNGAALVDFPIQQLISYAYNSGEFADKFALLSCKWINKFSSEEVMQIVNALLSYIDNNEANLPVLLECCLAVKSIVLSKAQQINLSGAVQKIVPIAIKLFSSNDSVQVLWPMITLISKLISSVECNMESLQKALACNSLVSLLQTKEELIIQALCEMFRNIICTLPREQAQPTIYDLVINFLGFQLPKSHLASFDEVLRLWYLLLREYSYVQNRNQQLKSLFLRHYNGLLPTLNQRLLYILQEYILLDLVQLNTGMFTGILKEFYQQGEVGSDESLKLKIAATSVHITLITKFGIGSAHNSDLLLRYLSDLINSFHSNSKLIDTFKTSILAVINRYIILFKVQFVQFLNSNSIPWNVFQQAWFLHMDSLTSRTASKINAIALLFTMQDLDPHVLQSRFEFMMKKVIPEVVDSVNMPSNAPKVGVSPTFRFSENILSQRKEAIRKKEIFCQINLRELFASTIKNIISQQHLDQAAVNRMMGEDSSNLDLLYKLLS